MEIVADSSVFDSMAGVVAARTPAHDICLEGQHVDKLAFALIAPLRAEHDRRHQSGVSAREKTVKAGDICNWRLSFS